MCSYHGVVQREGQGRRLKTYPRTKTDILHNKLLENQGRKPLVRTAHKLEGNIKLDLKNLTLRVSTGLCWLEFRSGTGACK